MVLELRFFYFDKWNLVEVKYIVLKQMKITKKNKRGITLDLVVCRAID